MLLYLDLNCFNRPFDDQSQDRIAKETEAILQILQRVTDGVDQMAWSAILSYENSQHPLVDRRNEIAQWARRAVADIAIGEPLKARAEELTAAGITPLDAAHLACAETGGCDRFLTCDDHLIRRARRLALKVDVQNPTQYLEDQTDARTDSSR